MNSTFNPHFTSIAFETKDAEIVADFIVSFNPHFTSIAFETIGGSAVKAFKKLFQSSFYEYRL